MSQLSRYNSSSCHRREFVNSPTWPTEREGSSTTEQPS
ncbi:hypothetical protein RSAG8_09299, partial [Rhizoctonia solani AG-8 WAC10335]